MFSNCDNSWNRPWSTQEIVDNASNWTLAGDTGLLKYLESFSENLLSKAEETNTNLNGLLDDLSGASLSLDVIKNEFSSLHNVQFVESRVYEEDETFPADVKQENTKDVKVTEDERVQSMKDAVLRGIEVIDKYYEKVQVPASDSEDETDFPSFVLRPKDPYLDRPLPYVIGTEDWFNKWHVGLVDSSSESETDKVSEKFSDSDSESDLPVQNRSQYKGNSNSGSEPDLSSRKNINPVANSTFDESVNQQRLFGSSDSEDYNSVPAQAPLSNRNFAQELAAKLGNVIEQNTQVIEPDINKRPIQGAAAASSRIIGNIFSDEPPPIDDDDDDMFGKSNAQQGIFSGGSDLFDDLDDGSGLWGEKAERSKRSVEVPKSKSKLPNLFDDDIFSAADSQPAINEKKENITPKKIPEDLFDDGISDDDLFTEGTKHKAIDKPYIQSINKVAMPFFDDEPPELESNREDNLKSKKPVGGVKIFQGADLFTHQKIGGLLKVKRQESSESSDRDESTNRTIDATPSKVTEKQQDLFGDIDNSTVTKENIAAEIAPVKPQEPVKNTEKSLKQLSLFDDDDDIGNSAGLFEDDLFSISTKKFTSGLFEEKPLSGDLFASAKDKESGTDLFANIGVPSDTTSSTNLFSKVDPNIPPSSVTQQDQKSGSEVNITAAKPAKEVGNIKATSLFHPNSDDEMDDLFSTNKITESVQSPVAAPRTLKSEPTTKNVEESGDIQKSNTQDSSSTKTIHGSVNINLFDQNPPDDDNDDWDTKSDNNLFEENDATLFDNSPEISSHRSGLFDNEPPSLFYESSGIVRDFSTRAETDDSFNPYASSSRRFSSDIFNEQQSSDSFFVTKNKSHIESLGSIREVPNSGDKGRSYSNVDITPSGNADDLFADSTISATEAQTKPDIDESLRSHKVKTEGTDDLFGDFDVGSNLESDLFSPSKNNAFKSGDTVENRSKVAATVKLPVGATSLKKEEGDKAVENTQSPTATKITSPGKLKHNLNINVAALLPGVSAPKKRDVESNSSNESSSRDPDPTDSKPLSPSTPSKNSEDETQKTVNPEQASSGLPEILHSITKDRVRIPIKRRPSTRKARQESIRNSGVDFKINVPPEQDIKNDAEIEEAEYPTPVNIFEKTSKPAKKNDEELDKSDISFLDESVGSDSLFTKNIEKPRSKDNSSKPDVPLFEDAVESDPLFAEGIAVKTKRESSAEIIETPPNQNLDKSKVSLFDDPVDSGLLFDENVGIEKRTTITTSKDPLKKFETKQMSTDLFDDATEYDSLFSENVGVKTKKNISAPPKELKGNLSLFDDFVEPDPLFREIVPDKVKQKNINEPQTSSIFDHEKRPVIDSDSFESADFKKSDLFEDSEEFDDIFSSKKLPPKSNILKKSLFDDELDDDDIFGPSSSSEKSMLGKSRVETRASQSKVAKTAVVKKLENKTAVEDPLSCFDD